MLARHVTILAAALLLPTCSTGDKPRGGDISFSGFLGQDAGLQPAASGPASYVHIEPGIDLARFTAVDLEPPQAWISDAQRAKIGEDQLAYMLSALDHALRESLGAHWDLTDRSSPDVLRIRLAICNPPATGELSAFSRVVPYSLIADQPVKASASNFLNLDAVHAEVELLDGNKRLAAFVDRPTGSGSLGTSFPTWADVAAKCSFWGERLVHHLDDYGMVPTRNGPR